MKKFATEFKEFISRGNVLDMAVGIIIGGAFTAIVNSLVGDIINPVLGLFGSKDLSQCAVLLAGEAGTDTAVMLNYGNFIAAIINFIIMALIVFCIVKSMNKLTSKMPKKEEAPAEPTEKDCPYCMSKIAIKATRCPNCTSVLDEK